MNKGLNVQEIQEVLEELLKDFYGITGVELATVYDYREGDEVVSVVAIDKKEEILFNQELEISEIEEFISKKIEEEEKIRRITEVQARAAAQKVMRERRDERLYNDDYSTSKNKGNKGNIELDLGNIKEYLSRNKLIASILALSLASNVLLGTRINKNEEIMKQATTTIQQLKSAQSTDTQQTNTETNTQADVQQYQK